MLQTGRGGAPEEVFLSDRHCRPSGWWGSPCSPSVSTVPELLTGWGRTAATAATVVPGASLGAVLADPPWRGVVARGLGRSYGDAAQNAGGTVVAMASAVPGPPVIDAAGVVTVSAATTLDELLRFLVPRGWFVPVTPGTRHITVGGAVAADVHGKNHTADGSW